MKTLALLVAVLFAGVHASTSGQTQSAAPSPKPATSTGPAVKSAERFTEERGALRDARTGLLWTQSDSGADTNWNEARDYCKRKRGGWRLPSADELQALFDATQPVPCGRWTCGASQKFRLSGPWFWSSERSGSSEAAFVYLTTGNRNTVHTANRYGLQTLCVRRS